MTHFRIEKINLQKIKTPAFIVDEKALEDNLSVLDFVQKKTGCKILLALKGFAMHHTFPLLRKTLHGVCASGLHEARLGYEEFGKEVHTYSPSFKEEGFDEVVKYSDHIVFNSLTQWGQFKPFVKGKHLLVGLRVNPEKSVAGSRFGVYDPCSKNSRLGIKARELTGADLSGITGLHFHALCEQDATDLEKVLNAFEKKFSKYLQQMQWVNFGGGHHITRDGYDTKKLCELILGFKKRHPHIHDVYLEPGEAVALNTGILIATVIDIVKNEKHIAILDTSVECHLPDVLITRHEPQPYVPEVVGAKIGGKGKGFAYSYLLGGESCAAGDVISEYSFSKPLTVGDTIVFLDAAHYSMVKTNTFNGVPLPTIHYLKRNGKLETVKTFGYDDYKMRLS